MQKGRNTRLTHERISMLDKVNFIWEAQRGGPRRQKRATICVPAKPNPVQIGSNVSRGRGRGSSRISMVHGVPQGMVPTGPDGAPHQMAMQMPPGQFMVMNPPGAPNFMRTDQNQQGAMTNFHNGHQTQMMGGPYMGMPWQMIPQGYQQAPPGMTLGIFPIGAMPYAPAGYQYGMIPTSMVHGAGYAAPVGNFSMGTLNTEEASPKKKKSKRKKCDTKKNVKHEKDDSESESESEKNDDDETDEDAGDVIA
jgi:hypothetical protein